MMELERHLEVLLLDNDCVIVPELGGFMAHHVPSRYDEAEAMFLPPMRTLGFNSQLTMNDSLLARSYADLHGVSYAEASQRIAREVRQLRRQIERDGSCRLSGIGRLSLDDDGGYIFEPCQNGVLTPWLYGLEAFECKRIGAATLSSILPMPGQMRVVSPSVTSATPGMSRHHQPSLATIMSQIDPNTPHKEEKTISIKVSLLRNLAVSAVAAAALLLFARPVDSTQSLTSETSEASLLRPSQAVEAPVATEVSSEPRSIVGLLEAVSQRLNAEEAPVVVPTTGAYTIVLGYSIPSETVKGFVEDLHSQGARGAVLIDYKSQNVVVYGSYGSMDEANAELQELLSSKKVQSGWIMQMK